MASNRKTITAHCIIKNEENFVDFAVRSVIDHVDSVIIFDTGSTDSTIKKVKALVAQYPNKIIFEEKGFCDKIRHTQLRQEMMARTQTDWFFILDGDEVYPKRTIEEAVDKINSSEDINWLVSPYYVCVGDVYHTYYNEKYNDFWQKKGFFTIRFIKNRKDIEIRNTYESDSIYYKNGGEMFFKKGDMNYLQNKYWHLTYLRRSTKDDDCFTTGIEKNRAGKRRLTYFLIGRKIKERVPEVFLDSNGIRKMSFWESFFNFLKMLFTRRELVSRWVKFFILKQDYKG